MARPKNEETILKIREAARQLFCEKGYKGTSYSDISRASNVNRATVQDYYPKKRILATEHLNRLRACAVEITELQFPGVQSYLAQQYLLGQIYIASLLSCVESRRFLSDILEDRTFMEGMIARDVDWSIVYVHAESDGAIPEEAFQDMICVMGGVYELMFYSVRTGQPIDIAKRLRPGMEVLATLLPISEREDAELLDRCVLSTSEVSALGRAAFAQAFNRPWAEQ